ncbi:hypothetical protein C791_6788 [Amycolatopsis azurea DSM 43854]|uniref:Uncharacterized protein n=1 Tax=Amycolatopsis azurea DSM 43854 TaxID=1238180 RepID=M2QC90_9PSEU|nr:hypothetical protein C791_6788 [Amycolatopsis azurea DSM 43854]
MIGGAGPLALVLIYPSEAISQNVTTSKAPGGHPWPVAAGRREPPPPAVSGVGAVTTFPVTSQHER